VRPSAGTLAALTLAVVLAACGGGSNVSAERPTLPRSVAEDLSGRSDQIADALDGGDVCGAAHLADELKHAVDAAVAGGRIPPAFQDELERTASDLQNQVNCEEAKEHKDEGESKGKKKGHDDETTTLGTTVSTTEESG
jgi:hypothetical protein